MFEPSRLVEVFSSTKSHVSESQSVLRTEGYHLSSQDL